MVETTLLDRVDMLQARQDIHDVLVSYCRGADRCDAMLMKACFHDDAWDNHGFYDGPAAAFADQAAVNLRMRFTATRHLMMNETIVIDGDVAHAETYILAIMRKSEEGTLFDVTFGARYLDRVERRDGVWKIAHRTLVSDGNRIDPVTQQDPRLDLGKRGARGSDDPSHCFFASPDPTRADTP
jgi:SnoaL-like domain